MIILDVLNVTIFHFLKQLLMGYLMPKTAKTEKILQIYPSLYWNTNTNFLPKWKLLLMIQLPYIVLLI